MGELRAYALPVAELYAAVGATAAARARFVDLAQRAFGRPATSLAERLGPIHRQVPGTRPIPDDEPTPADLDAVLDGRPLPPERAPAGWRLVEAFASGLARDSTTVAAADLPVGTLAPLGLPVPPVRGLVAGWLLVRTARTVPALQAWARALDPDLDVVVIAEG